MISANPSLKYSQIRKDLLRFVPCLAKNPHCKKSPTLKREIFIGFLVLRVQEGCRLSNPKCRKDLKITVLRRIRIASVTLFKRRKSDKLLCFPNLQKLILVDSTPFENHFKCFLGKLSF